MAKYIIDVPDEAVGFMDGEMSFFIEPKIKDERRRHYMLRIDEEDVSIYTEPDRNVIEDEVWEFVKKIECLTIGETEDCFDIEYDGIPFIANMFSYQEAKAKYEEWLKQKDEIHVGDEVQFTDVTNTIITLVVTRVDDSRFDGINNKGRLYIDRTNNLWEKTGRHFDEVEELLKKMGGGKE